jgi:hypothetical protein
MAITDSIKWHIDDVYHELTRNADCKGVFIYQRGDNLPQFFTVKEAAALSMQIRRMVDRSDFALASRGWPDKSRGT